MQKNKYDVSPSLLESKDDVYDMKHIKSPGLDGIPHEFYKKKTGTISSPNIL